VCLAQIHLIVGPLHVQYEVIAVIKQKSIEEGKRATLLSCHVRNKCWVHMLDVGKKLPVTLAQEISIGSLCINVDLMNDAVPFLLILFGDP